MSAMTGQRLFERAGMDTDQPGGRDVRLAWLCLIVLPLFFLFFFAVGEGLSALLGHPDGAGTEVSRSDILLTTVPALIVFSCRRSSQPRLPIARRVRATGAAGSPQAS